MPVEAQPAESQGTPKLRKQLMLDRHPRGLIPGERSRPLAPPGSFEMTPLRLVSKAGI